MKLEHKRSRLKCFVSTIALKSCLSCLHFFLLSVMLAGPHFLMSHFLIIINDSAVSCRFKRIQNFCKISNIHCGKMTWANDMQYFKESFSAIIIAIITMMMMMMMMMMMTIMMIVWLMIVTPWCARSLCFLVLWNISLALIHGNKHQNLVISLVISSQVMKPDFLVARATSKTFTNILLIQRTITFRLKDTLLLWKTRQCG